MMKPEMIAPCGMNCTLCYGYLREKNRCSGCRSDNIPFKYCTTCIIKNCEILKDKNLEFCSDKCHQYPCSRLKGLDKRYRTKYMMSMIENLEYISQNSISSFLENEEKRWVKDNAVFCVHHKEYIELPAEK